MIRWSVDLLIGISDIDESHRQLVKLLNEAYEGFLIGINIEEFLVDDLFNYMVGCFDCEETWMVNASYPDISAHKAEHELFMTRFMEIKNQHQYDASSSVEVLMFLNNWISHHIRGTDKKLGLFIAENST